MILSALSKRARFLLNRDGKDSWVSGVHLGKDLTLPEFYLSVDEKGTLTIEYNSVEAPMIHMESPNGTVIRTSRIEVLEAVLTELGRYTVLDDLSSV